MRSPRRPGASAPGLLALVLVGVLTLAITPYTEAYRVAAPTPTPTFIHTPEPSRGTAVGGADRIYWSHAVRSSSANAPGIAGSGGFPGAPAGGIAPPGTPPVLPRPAAIANCPLDVGFNLNFSVALTPANGSGAVPFTVGYDVVVHAGFGPYLINGAFVRTDQGVDWATINQADAYSYSGTLAGNVTIPEAGIWEFYFYVTDSACSQGDVYGDVTTWGPAGPNAVTLSASNLTGSTPMKVTFTASVVAPPANASWVWYGIPQGFGVPRDGVATPYQAQNATFLQNGTFGVRACVIRNVDYTFYGCSPTVNVTATGPSEFSLATSRSTGYSPLNLTVWLNVTHPAWLPTTNWSLYAENRWTFGPGPIHSLAWNETLTCGFNGFGPLEGPGVSFCNDSGASFTFYASTQNATAAGTLSLEVAPPLGSTASFTFSVDPLGGPAPLAIDINASVVNSSAPLYYNYSVIGKTSLGPGATWFPNRFNPLNDSWGANATNASLSIPISITSPGFYWIAGSIWQGGSDPCFFDGPVFEVGANVSLGATYTGTYCEYTPPPSGWGGGPGTGGGGGSSSGNGSNSSGNGSGDGSGGGSGNTSGGGSGNHSGGAGEGSRSEFPPLEVAAAAVNGTGSAFLGVSGSFWANASGGESPYTASWNFGDGGTSTATSATGRFSAQHLYDRAGRFLPSVTIQDANGSVLRIHLAAVVVTADELQPAPTGTGPAPASPAPTTSGPISPTAVGVAIGVAAVALLAIALAVRGRRPAGFLETVPNEAEEAPDDPDLDPPTGR